MKIFKKLILLSFIFLVSSCGTLKEGFKNQKKNNNDEFLVEKKSPLIMPPDYNELPMPNLDTSETENKEKSSGDLKDKKIGEDENKTLEKNIQKITDNNIANIDSIIQDKEKEIIQI